MALRDARADDDEFGDAETNWKANMGMMNRVAKKAAKPVSAPIEAPSESGTRKITERSVDDIRPDPNQPRNHFDTEAILETLAGPNPRIREPLRIRATRPGEKNRDGKRSKAPWTIIEGETRWRAAVEIGMTTVPCQPPEELADADLLVEQLASSVTKKSLRPLEEADAVARLANGKIKLSAEEIAHRTGLRSTKAVYRAIALSKLCPDAREALESGAILHGVALLLATITDPEAQATATIELVKSKSGESIRESRFLIERNYHLALVRDSCGFDPADASLPGGPCGKCPKSTEAQRWLGILDDEKKDAQCTDRKCFANKRAASWQRRKAEAIKNGIRVVEGEEALKLFTSPFLDMPKDVTIASLDEQGYVDGVFEKFRDIVPELKPTMLVAAHNKVYECVPRAALVEALRAAGAGQLAENEAAWLEDESDESETRETSRPPLPTRHKPDDNAWQKAQEERERSLVRVLDAIDPIEGMRFWRFIAGLAVRMQQNMQGLADMISRRCLPVVADADYTLEKERVVLLNWIASEDRDTKDCAQILVEMLVTEDDESFALAMRHVGIADEETASEPVVLESTQEIESIADAGDESVPVGKCDVCYCTEHNACPGGCSWANKEATRCTRCAATIEIVLDAITESGCIGYKDDDLLTVPEIDPDTLDLAVSHLVATKRIESKKKRWVFTSTERLARKKAEAKATKDGAR